MENQNLNANKRYNKFRQARRKKDKSNTINVDEDALSDANNNANPTTSKTRRTKHVKLPVLNECKGLFENVIIGRSAKKVGEFGDIAVTPEDRARLHEDIHALAKVGRIRSFLLRFSHLHH
uniref:RNA-binding protein pno-1 n=2 Tax=Lygus hesperus TaxID=30085 RepID=A0A0A9WFA9_LYGHE